MSRNFCFPPQSYKLSPAYMTEKIAETEAEARSRRAFSLYLKATEGDPHLEWPSVFH